MQNAQAVRNLNRIPRHPVEVHRNHAMLLGTRAVNGDARGDLLPQVVRRVRCPRDEDRRDLRLPLRLWDLAVPLVAGEQALGIQKDPRLGHQQPIQLLRAHLVDAGVGQEQIVGRPRHLP